MPFTFAHPAIILPIKEKYTKYFNLTALVLGSMAPDFEYFIRFKPMGTIGHSLLGFFYLNLPLCLIITYIFHNMIKKPFIMSLPTPLDERYSYMIFEKWKISSIKEWIIFIYSSLLGMASHVLWDGFTHTGGFFVSRISFLTKNVFIMGLSIPIYKFMQHGSTFIGFLIIFMYIYHIRSFKNQYILYWRTKDKIFYYGFVLLIAFMFLMARIFLMDDIKLSYIGAYIVTFLNGGFIGMILAFFTTGKSRSYITNTIRN